MNKRTSRPVFFGSWRFVKLASFIEATGYWRNHDRLTDAQVPLLEKFLAGDRSVVPELRRIAAEIDALRERLYCSDPEVVKPLGR